MYLDDLFSGNPPEIVEKWQTAEPNPNEKRVRDGLSMQRCVGTGSAHFSGTGEVEAVNREAFVDHGCIVSNIRSTVLRDLAVSGSVGSDDVSKAHDGRWDCGEA